MKRSTTNGGPYSLIASPTTTNCTDATVVNGTTYYYVVSATNTAGESANSSQSVATPTSTAPVNASISMSSGTLTISWPADHTGWRLQSQTNSLGTNWVDVPNATMTNSMVIPVNPNSGSVFYRLVYP